MGHIHADVYREHGFLTSFADRVSWKDGVKAHEGCHVSICSWDDAHAEQILYALEHKCLVMAEKPICRDWRGLHDIKAAAETGVLSCNLPLAFDARLHAFIDREPYHIEADYHWGRLEKIAGWRSQVAGYSFVLGGGVHMADLAMRLKRDRLSTVQATGERTHPDFPNFTFITAVGNFAEGGTLRMNINCAYDGAHEHRIVLWTRTQKLELTNWGADKTAALRRFIEKPEALGLFFDAHAVCLAIEDALQTGEQVKVRYP